MSAIVVRGQTFSSVEDLRDRLAVAARGWELDHPGQYSPADGWRGENAEERQWVRAAAALLIQTATEPREFELARHLGEGPNAPYYAALLDRLEEGLVAPEPTLHETLLKSLGWPTVSRDPALRARARSLFEQLGRNDLLLYLLSYDDPDGDLLTVLKRTSSGVALDPEVAASIGWVLAKRSPAQLLEAARHLAHQSAPTCAAFLERAREANPQGVSASEDALRAALGLD